MALKKNTLEGGTNGTSITTGNSGGGSGDAFGLVSVGANATGAYSSAQAMHGSLSALCTISSAGAANNVQFVYQGYTATQMAVRGYFRFVSFPTVTSPIINLSLTAGNEFVYLNSDGTIRVDDLTGIAKYTSPALSLNTWYRIELVFIRGTTTSNGTINFAIYAGDSTTALHTFSASTLNTGTTATISNAQFGRPSTTAATAYSFYLDDVAVNDGAATFIGPSVVPNVAPTANAGADQAAVEPWATVTLSGTDSDSDGTVVTRAWTQTSGSPTVTLSGSGATRTFEAPATIAGTTLTFTYTVTDNGGATGTDTMTVAVLPVTERAVIGGVEVPMRVLAAIGTGVPDLLLTEGGDVLVTASGDTLIRT